MFRHLRESGELGFDVIAFKVLGSEEYVSRIVFLRLDHM